MANKLDITSEEADMFTKHMKNPEFIKRFADYARELQDPKAALEMNDYLRQLESEGQAESVYGKGVQLIMPDASFVIKTKDATNGTRVYINVCTSPKVDAMTQEIHQGESGHGAYLSFPMVTHSREGKKGTAPDGGPLLVWDIAINPETNSRAAMSSSVLRTLVITAIERIEEVSGCKLLREYKLPKLNYKGVPGAEQPSVMVVRTGEGGEVVEGRLRPSAQAAASSISGSRSDSSMQADIGRMRTRSGFSFNKATAARTQQQAVLPKSAMAMAGQQHVYGAVTPTWKLVERHRADLGNAWSDTGRGLKSNSRIPQALVVKVDLPGVESASAVQLEVGSDAVDLVVPGKYSLQLTPAHLKYTLSAERGSAKFDRTKQQLTLTLEVAPQQHQMRQQEMQQQLPQPQRPLTPTTAAPGSVYAIHQQEHQQHHEPQLEHSSACVADAKSSNPISAAPGTAPQAASGVAASICSHDHEAPAEDALAVVSRKDPSEGRMLNKTPNQLLWEQLHSTLDQNSQLGPSQPDRGCAASAIASADEQHQPPNSPPQPVATTANSAMLKPRLLSRHANIADFD